MQSDLDYNNGDSEQFQNQRDMNDNQPSDEDENQDNSEKEDNENSNTNRMKNNKEKHEQKQYQKKVFLSQQFYKGKRVLTKIITQYFANMKQQLNQHKNSKVYLKKDALQDVMLAIMKYVNVRHGGRSISYDLKFKFYQLDKKVKEQRNGLFTYLAESQKIVNYKDDTKIHLIHLEKSHIKIPDLATPVPFQDAIYFLDASNFHQKRKVFVPDQHVYKIQPNDQIKILEVKPKYSRIKCGIVRDKQYIYLLGGYLTSNKILSNKCEKFHPKTNTFVGMADMKIKHNCPSGCILKGVIYVFSMTGIQYLQDNSWKQVETKCFGSLMFPFQFVIPISQSEILILGGMHNKCKMNEVKLYDVVEKTVDNYGDILPQGTCNERSWGPQAMNQHICMFSNIQASIYPQVASKANMTQILYATGTSAFLNQVIMM